MNKRIDSLDYLRGISLILVVFFHTSVYNFVNIDKIDFNNPPIIMECRFYQQSAGYDCGGKFNQEYTTNLPPYN